MSENSTIYLFVSTSVMLFGLDVKDISIVILLSPFNSLNSFIQAGGRAGRRQGDGNRKQSVIYENAAVNQMLCACRKH